MKSTSTDTDNNNHIEIIKAKDYLECNIYNACILAALEETGQDTKATVCMYICMHVCIYYVCKYVCIYYIV